jgi:cell division protein FtsB
MKEKMGLHRKMSRKRSKKLKRYCIFIILICLFGFMLFGKDGIVTYISLLCKVKALEKEIEKIKTENLTLIERITKLKSDPAYIEKLARKLGMKKPQEKIIKFIPPPHKD